MRVENGIYPLRRLMLGDSRTVRRLLPIVPVLVLAELLAVSVAQIAGALPGLLVLGGLATIAVMIVVAGASAYQQGGVLVSWALASAPVAGYTSFIVLGEPSYDLLTALGVAVTYGCLFGTIGYVFGAAVRRTDG